MRSINFPFGFDFRHRSVQVSRVQDQQRGDRPVLEGQGCDYGFPGGRLCRRRWHEVVSWSHPREIRNKARLTSH